MSVAIYAVQGVGNDSNSGSTTTASPTVSGTLAATVVGATVDLSLDAPDLSAIVANQDTIRLNGRTDGRGGTGFDGAQPRDIFKITAVDNILKTVDVTPSPNSITSGVIWAIGGAHATIPRAFSTIIGGETCYAKGTWTGHVELYYAAAGNDPTTPMILEGYTTIPGDGGMATIDGLNVDSIGILFKPSNGTLFHVVRNIRVTRFTSIGFSFVYGGYPSQFVNCEVDHCGKGFLTSALVNFINCYVHDNTIAGFDCHDHNEFFACMIRNNGKGILSDSGVRVHRCILYNNTTHNIHITGAFTSDPTFVVDSIIDGNGVSDYGIFGFGSASYQGKTKIVNSQIINCDVGIHVSTDEGLWNVNVGLLMYGNGTNFENYVAQDGFVTGLPTFVNEGTDWTPTSGSAAIEAGFDIRTNQFATAIGSLPTIGGIDPIANPIADYPSVNDVRDGVAFDSGSQSGTLVLPSPNDVRDGIGFGAS